MKIIATGTMGKVGEMRVALDLLSRGRQVFEAVSPSTSCDLIYIGHRGRLIRVEVRSASHYYPSTFGAKDVGRSDVLALVINGGPIKYRRTPRRRAGQYNQYNKRSWGI